MWVRILPLIAAAVMVCLIPVSASAQLDKISNQDASSGLRAMLEKGAGAAVDLLARPDGFFGNPKVKIPLPESISKVDKLMHNLGMGKYSDQLVLTMNRAAEAAMPEARTLLVDAVKKMSVQDAKGILTGGQDAATQYFKRTTSDQLRARFLPIVKKATEKVQLAEKYNQYAEKGVKLGLVRKDDANLDSYVTQKTLDGLFVMVAEQEKKIRDNPAQAASTIISKVFGALK
jgi:hypothetical protein